MTKLSIALILFLFSIFFFFIIFHAKGQIITQLNSTNNLLQEDTLEDQLEAWYDKLDTFTLVTTKIQIYFHAYNKVNQIQVAKSLIPGILPPFFGNIYAFDYQLTAGQDIDSTPLGYGQGFFAESSRGEFSALLSINLVLSRYQNHTLTLIGQDRFNDEYRELSIVGGTGYFRLATGNAVMYNVFRETDVAIVRLTMFVRRYTVCYPVWPGCL